MLITCKNETTLAPSLEEVHHKPCDPTLKVCSGESNRLSKLKSCDTGKPGIPLPKVNWNTIGRTNPKHMEIDYQGPTSPLPQADIFIVTWTTAEWSALDHVFFDSETERKSGDDTFKDKWLAYQKDAIDTGENDRYPLWGEYQMVGVDNAHGEELAVLIFHSESHLAYNPFVAGLTTMLNQIISEVNPQVFISTGTAGGSNMHSFLGDTVVTNAGYVDCQKTQNYCDINHTTIKGDWFPDSSFYEGVQENLFFKLSDVCTSPQLESMVQDMHENNPSTSDYNLSDLKNQLIDSDQLKQPCINLRPNVPLKSTDYYYNAASATSDAQYAVLEMDDAIIASVCQDAGVNFAFYRNISNPIVPEKDHDGNFIPADVRADWSGEIEKNFGFYTSFNGALACYAGVAGCDFSPRK